MGIPFVYKRSFERIVKRIPSNVNEPIVVTKIHHAAEFFRETREFVLCSNSASKKRKQEEKCH